MRLLNVILLGYRSIEFVEFEAGAFTVLFGKNNAGKTNLLEAIHEVINGGGYSTLDDGPSKTETSALRLKDSDYASEAFGALHVELHEGVPFDDSVVAAMGDAITGPPPHRVAFTDGGLFATDPHDSYRRAHDALTTADGASALLADPAITQFEGLEPVESLTLRTLFLDWKFNELNQGVGAAIGQLACRAGGLARRITMDRSAWLEAVDVPEIGIVYQLREDTMDRLAQFLQVTTELLPDFLDGSIEAVVNPPTMWQHSPKIELTYEERGRGPITHPLFADDERIHVEGLGQGAARWIAAAAQVALRLITDRPELTRLRDLGLGGSGYVLLIDEPEAHLHPSAVASIVRWCRQMVARGFTVITASHHEEFLRQSSDDVTLVHVTRDATRVRTNARTLPVTTTTRLQELAQDIGMHPASALALHRAILFVEGSLDEAVLDEFAGLELDAAGVKIIAIHGTRNYEGIVSAELLAGLGIKTGVLFDNTNPQTMLTKSNRKRSGEEQKLVKLLGLFEEKGLRAPVVFGVSEDDLLWALPSEAIREHYSGSFPGWKELRDECREALCKSPSDSVDWKAFARQRYGLEIDTPAGVRNIVRTLDLQNVGMPSIRAVTDEIIQWAKQSPQQNDPSKRGSA